jgi:chromosome partitioning protein
METDEDKDEGEGSGQSPLVGDINRINTIDVSTSKTGYQTQVIIVPLGISKDSVSEVVTQLKEEDKPQRYRIAPEIPDYQEEMQTAIYQDRKYIWDYEGLDFLYDYFADLLEN